MLRSSLGICLMLPGICLAQDRDEVLSEIEELIAEVEESGAVESPQKTAKRESIALLRQARGARKSAIRIERQIEQVDDDDVALLKSLEEKLSVSELSIEKCFALLELIELRVELEELLEEVREEELTSFEREAKSLLVLQRKRADLTAEYFELRLEEDGGQIDQVERVLEELHEDFESQHVLLELQVELHWAREEGDSEQIEELIAELKELRKQNPVDAQGDGDRRRTKMQSPRSETAAAARSQIRPVDVSVEQISAASKLSFQNSILPLLKQHCYECHDAGSASGDLNLEQLSSVRPFVSNRRHWLNIKQQIRIRSMPPEGSSGPSDEDRSVLVAWLTHAIDHFDYSRVRRPGFEAPRRLTHEEYNNTVRDLFGVDLRPTDRFPADLKATSGFDNSSNSLFIQPVLMERYFGAAEQIVHETLSSSVSSELRKRVEQMIIGHQSLTEAVLSFAARAWRRPLTSSEKLELAKFFQDAAARTESDRTGFLQAIQVILVSPNFLMRTDQTPKQTRSAYAVSSFELASRLSYFLWASMPDRSLFELARRDLLREKDVLEREVLRMLDDPKSETLGQLFAAQWLGFGNLHHIQPDQIDNPWATDSLLQAMKDESAMFFNSMVEANLPIDALITADYTYLNQELAGHYRIEGVVGDDMRRVVLRNSRRGGILGHASILATTSFPGRTSPVVRGNWILSELLGTPPPPPPPNVSQFDESIEERDSLSARQKLELHRQNPNCYVCHNEIDPLGFALEEFGWFGRERRLDGEDDLDVEGMLPNGTVVNGISGLRDALISERRDDLVEQMTRKMLSYALCRQIEYYDESTVNEIVETVENDNRRMRTLILAIVRSDAFRMKQPGRD